MEHEKRDGLKDQEGLDANSGGGVWRVRLVFIG